MYGNETAVGGRLTIELGENDYHSVDLEEAITPAMVEQLVLEHR
jgi:hypothetical protein